MKKLFKKEIIIAFLVGIILASSIAVYASINASEVDYKSGKKVSQALDDLYSKIPSGTIPITTKGNQIDVSQYQYADTTGLYTESELQAQTGEGTYWKKETGLKPSSDGIITLNIGFEPKHLYLKGSCDTLGGPTCYAYFHVYVSFVGMYFDGVANFSGNGTTNYYSGATSQYWPNYSYSNGVMTLGGFTGNFLNASFSYMARNSY